MRLIFTLFAFFVSTNFSHAQERQWTLNAALQDVSLEFGVGETDDIGLSFYCEVGSGNVAIFLPFDRNLISKNGKVPVTLKTEDDVFPIQMMASKSEGSRSGGLEGPVSVDGTVMEALRNSRELSFTAIGKTIHFPMLESNVDGFLKACTGEVF